MKNAHIGVKLRMKSFHPCSFCLDKDRKLEEILFTNIFEIIQTILMVVTRKQMNEKVTQC